MTEGSISIELPQSIPLEIADTAPGIKGATATGRTKPATLSNGVVQNTVKEVRVFFLYLTIRQQMALFIWTDEGF